MNQSPFYGLPMCVCGGGQVMVINRVTAGLQPSDAELKGRGKYREVKKASPERFEHSRAKPNRWQLLIAGDPVNHSGKVT